MEPLNLDPGNYRGSYKMVGGRPSLDFVNTVSWPGTDREHDWLDSIGNLQRWLQAAGIPAPHSHRADLLDAALPLRAVLSAVLRPLAHGKRPARKDLEALNERIVEASTRRVIDPSTLAWKWKPLSKPADTLAPLVLDAAELVTAETHDRLRHCPACDWLFEDKTRNGLRRWCDMADCGSRDKSRRYYRRIR